MKSCMKLIWCCQSTRVHFYYNKNFFFPPAQIVVPGTSTTAFLQQLLPNTDYNVGVVALYSDGEGPALSDAGKTRKIRISCIPKPSPLDLIEHRIDSEKKEQQPCFSLSAPQWPEEPPRVRPHNQHPVCDLGPR